MSSKIEGLKIKKFDRKVDLIDGKVQVKSDKSNFLTLTRRIQNPTIIARTGKYAYWSKSIERRAAKEKTGQYKTKWLVKHPKNSIDQ